VGNIENVSHVYIVLNKGCLKDFALLSWWVWYVRLWGPDLGKPEWPQKVKFFIFIELDVLAVAILHLNILLEGSTKKKWVFWIKFVIFFHFFIFRIRMMIELISWVHF
jgi:hypothetical protein